jgi:hypothetical protein
LMDVSRLTGMGWKARTAFVEGLQQAYTSAAAQLGR